MRAMPIPMRYKKGTIIFNMFSVWTVKSQTLMLALAVSLYAFSGNALTLADNGASDYQIVIPESRNNAQIDFYDFLYTKLFSTRKNKKNSREISWVKGKYLKCATWNSYTILQLFLYSIIYWLYKCWITSWGNFFFSNIFSFG